VSDNRSGSASQFYGGLSYGDADGRELLLDVLAPVDAGPAARPLVIYVHGGGWHEGDRGAAMHPWLNPFLVANGYITASITYRLSSEARFPAPLLDVHAAIRWLRDHAHDFRVDPSRIGLWGHSAGAHLAALAALTAPPEDAIRAVVLSACPADLRTEDLTNGNEVARLIGAGGRATLAEASPICQVRGAAPPFLLAHGTHDQIVAAGQGEAFRDALRAAGNVAEWVPIAGAGHEWADRPGGRGLDETESSFGDVALPFFDRYLQPLG
jgi:acetyl esterase/lipase